MLWLTPDARVFCDHGGALDMQASQTLVWINGAPALVEPDPVGRSVGGCPLPPPMKRCMLTVNVSEGYSELVRIATKRVCLDNLVGLTEGSPPGTVHYRVAEPGQSLVGGQR